jgi:hypothetical protein
MSEQSRAALAAAGANASVETVVTGRLEDAHQHYAYLPGRYVTQQNADAAELLTMSSASLEGLSSAAVERADAEPAIVWRARLCELLEQHLQAENDLQFVMSAQGLAASTRPGSEPPSPSPEPPSDEPPSDEPPSPDAAPIEGDGGGTW